MVGRHVVRAAELGDGRALVVEERPSVDQRPAVAVDVGRAVDLVGEPALLDDQVVGAAVSEARAVDVVGAAAGVVGDVQPPGRARLEGEVLRPEVLGAPVRRARPRRQPADLDVIRLHAVVRRLAVEGPVVPRREDDVHRAVPAHEPLGGHGVEALVRGAEARGPGLQGDAARPVDEALPVGVRPVHEVGGVAYHGPELAVVAVPARDGPELAAVVHDGRVHLPVVRLPPAVVVHARAVAVAPLGVVGGGHARHGLAVVAHVEAVGEVAVAREEGPQQDVVAGIRRAGRQDAHKDDHRQDPTRHSFLRHLGSLLFVDGCSHQYSSFTKA